MGKEIDYETVHGEQKFEKCPECGCEMIERQDGEIFCKKCGFVID